MILPLVLPWPPDVHCLYCNARLVHVEDAVAVEVYDGHRFVGGLFRHPDLRECKQELAS